jgi:hypothetical protein
MGLAVVLATAGVASAKEKAGKGKDKAPKEDPVARGAYIVSHSGCNECHTPYVFNKDLGMPMPDMSKFLSGAPCGRPGLGDEDQPEDRPRHHQRLTSRPSRCRSASSTRRT